MLQVGSVGVQSFVSSSPEGFMEFENGRIFLKFGRLLFVSYFNCSLFQPCYAAFLTQTRKTQDGLDLVLKSAVSTTHLPSHKIARFASDE